MKLQEITDYKVMRAKECMDALGWRYKINGDRVDDVTCTCGEQVQASGYLGIEKIECLKCGKQMVDLFSPIPSSPVGFVALNPDDYELEEGRHWIAVDGKGGIKL